MINVLRKILLTVAAQFTYFILLAQQSGNEVYVVGAMQRVMWNGELYSTIHLDTISNKKHLYGIGPMEYLAGELIVVDGKSFKSTVLSDTTMKVKETFNVGAPFFAYSTIAKWKEMILPDSVLTMEQLESHLKRLTFHYKRPFLFKLKGMILNSKIHVVNLPKGATVNSPDQAHQGKKTYSLINEESEIIGFFSTKHQAIFTHHNTYLHMHLITLDRKKMGHLDEVLFKAGTMTLYLPIEIE